MKNLFLTLTAGLILLTGCSKDESFEQIDVQSNDDVYVLDQNLDQAAFRSLEISNFPSGVNNAATTTTNDFAHASGLYEPMIQNPVILSWNGNRDNTGTYGMAELEIRRPTYTIHLVMETECITVDGNTAVYGATITQVIELSGNTPDLTPMWRFYFRVKDNVQNSHNSTDQISNQWIFASPRSASLCSVYPPNHRIWSSNGLSSVLSPGFVEVSNNPE